MRLLAGAICITSSLFMFLVISLLSQAFPIVNGDIEIGYFNIDNLIYPIAALLIGLCFIGHKMFETVRKAGVH